MTTTECNLAKALRFCAYVLNTSPVADVLGPLEEASRVLPGGAQFWEDTSQDDRQEVSMTLRVDWTRLFRGLSPDYGPKPPYELLYAPRGNEVAELLAVKRTYESAGLKMADDAHNRPDYLGFELEFTAWLLESGEGGVQYLADHLAWVPDFCYQATAFAHTSFYRWFLDFMSAVCTEAASLV